MQGDSLDNVLGAQRAILQQAHADFVWHPADDDPRVNPWGGAIAVGHPLASSGVRLMTQLSRHFAERPDVRYGMTTMCIGIGMGGTVIWENPAWNGDEK